MANKMQRDTNTIYVFDVDGTLTAARQRIEPEMEQFMEDLKKQVKVALVGGSDLVKIAEQMGGDDVVEKFDYLFSENGLVAYKDGKKIGQQNLLKHMGEETLQKVINFSLKYLSELTLPAKRGDFVDFRHGMINICPLGRNNCWDERLQFIAYDQEHHVRDKFKAALEKEFAGSGLKFAIGGQISIDVFPIGWDKTYCLQYIEEGNFSSIGEHHVRDKFKAALEKEFAGSGLKFAIGGQISIDVFPIGWDKTYCLQYIEEGNFSSIHFFGDKTAPGGNDHEIFADPRTVGHTVTSPEDTRRQVKALLQGQ